MPPERTAAIALPSAPSTSGTTATGKSGHVGRVEQQEQVLRTARPQRGDRAVDGLGAGAQIVFVGQLAEDAAEEGLGVPFRQVEMDDDGDFLADERGDGRGLCAGGLFCIGAATVSSRAIGIERNMRVLHQVKEWVDHLASFSS